MGVSLNIVNQSVGAVVTQDLKLNYCYHIHIKCGHNLSLGLGAGIYHRRFDFSKLRFDEDEQNIPVSAENELHPDFDFGIEYNYKNFTLGMASNHITIMIINATIFKIPLQNHVYAGYLANLGHDISLMPRLDFFNSGSITSYGISADVSYHDKFNTGVAYRSGALFIIRAGVRISSVLFVNYS